MDDTTNPSSADQLAAEHVCVDDIGTQLINIESVLQTIREQASVLESSGMETSALELKSLLPKLESLQTSHRKKFDAHARALIRDLHVFDLPDELLRNVFQHVAGGLETKGNHGIVARSDIRSIMSCRLVCHRFCGTSSHLLLWKLEVSITNSSLARLEKVSRHPTISVGVKSLSIYVGLYDAITAHTFQDFEIEAARILRGTGGARRHVQHRYILDAVEKHIIAGSSRQEKNEHLAALRRAYDRYKQFLGDQKVLLKGNTFSQRVATAVARMPTIAELTIHDGGIGSRDPWTQVLSPLDQLIQKTLPGPHYWSLDVLNRLVRPSVDFLCQLPLAVGRAGSFLTQLHITFTPAVDVKLSLSEEEVRGVVKATQNLRVLSISFNSLSMPSHGSHTSEKWTHMSKLMCLFLEAPNLREASLERKGELSDNESLGLVVSLLPWTKLRKVVLVRVPIHFNELAACVEQLEPAAFIEVERVRLRSGTWADLLDLLRTKANCSSDVRSPRGGEDRKSIPEWHKKFRSVGGQESLAAQYIRGLPLKNPLRQHNDGSDM